jgi:hypothetical protein
VKNAVFSSTLVAWLTNEKGRIKGKDRALLNRNSSDVSFW